ncbi:MULTISPECIES: peptide MFS transporter [Cysteiniphilum]|uniref:peptide MFS transporter n=1 Tax=Cysteiniphilum TaxID=2056696 RepID=UPI00177FDFAF|nr:MULTISPECIES: oligopeptide:H+ symporter [Cysteiniphilum]
MKFFNNSIAVILTTQVFATMSFAVLYSSLSLYLTNAFGYDANSAYSIVAVFLVYNYGLHMLGSYLGGLLSSYRVLFLIAMVFQVVSCFILAIPTETALYIGLTLFLVATGINVPCLNMMITQRFQKEHVKREKYFIWNHAASNLGFFAGYTAAGYYQLDNAYTSLFLVASVFNVLGLASIVLGWKAVADIDTPLTRFVKRHGTKALNKRYALLFTIFVAMTGVVFVSLLYPVSLKQAVLAVSVAFVVFFLWLANKQQDRQDRSNMRLYVVLALFAIVFWSMYYLAPMGITIFMQHNVNMELFGFRLTPQWLGNINIVIIVLGGVFLPPVFAKIRKKTSLTVSKQFLIGIASIAIGLGFLPIGILLANGQSSVLWVSLFFVFQSFGELMIAPIGYSMIAQLAKPKHQGLMMGVWMLLTGSTASVIASDLSGTVEIDASGANAIAMNESYLVLFGVLAVIGFVVAILLYTIIRKVKI